MDKPLYTYSFIIPHHNSPELLNRCLDSIPQREDIQIIVVDDNSAEDKRPCIKRDDVEVIYIDAEHTKGAGRARNYGLKAAKGKWLLFADCDDSYIEGFIDVLDKYNNKQVDVIYYNFEYRDGNNGKELTELEWKKYIEQFDKSKNSIACIKFRHNVPWTKMVDRNFIYKNNIQFEESQNGNDIFFSMLVGYFSRQIEVIKQPIYTYYRNNNSIQTSKPSLEGRICKFQHMLQLNCFFKYIGHTEYKYKLFFPFMIFIKELGMSFLLLVIRKWLRNQLEIEKLVNLIKLHSLK